MVFLPSRYPQEVYIHLLIFGGNLFLYTIAYGIPSIILLGIVVKSIVAAYGGFLVFFAYHSLDPPAFTVFLCVFYLAWYAWIHEGSRLRLA